MIVCPECGREFHSLGYPRHRTMHYEKRKEILNEMAKISEHGKSVLAHGYAGKLADVVIDRSKWDGECLCGHLHSEHRKLINFSPNYSAGRCGMCKDCPHFIHNVARVDINKVNTFISMERMNEEIASLAEKAIEAKDKKMIGEMIINLSETTARLGRALVNIAEE